MQHEQHPLDRQGCPKPGQQFVQQCVEHVGDYRPTRKGIGAQQGGDFAVWLS